MNIAIISSLKDKASTNIKENLINNFSFNKSEELFDNNNIFQSIINNNEIKLYTINDELIHADHIDQSIVADVFIFISKHRAEEGRASLTCHPIGNFGKAEHGGKDRTLCSSHSILLKNIFVELSKNVENSGYETTLEATHHGPYLEKPLLFVELGSNEKYWEDKKGGFMVAKSVISAMEKDNNNYESTFVIGGSHYNHYANKAMLETNFAVGHICAKYNLEILDENLIKQAIGKITPRPKFVLLDWKGLGKEKQRILEILEKNSIEFKRSDKVF